jgi:hypothetical protein
VSVPSSGRLRRSPCCANQPITRLVSHTDRVAAVVILAIELLVVLFVPRLPARLVLRWPLTGGRMRRGTAASLLAILLVVAIARLP